MTNAQGQVLCKGCGKVEVSATKPVGPGYCMPCFRAKQDKVDLPPVTFTMGDKAKLTVFAVLFGGALLGLVGLGIKALIDWEPEPETARPAICSDDLLKQAMMDEKGAWELTKYLADHCN